MSNLLDVEKKEKSGKGLCNVHMSEVGNMCEVSCLYWTERSPQQGVWKVCVNKVFLIIYDC